jgi:hypothetical protein
MAPSGTMSRGCVCEVEGFRVVEVPAKSIPAQGDCARFLGVPGGREARQHAAVPVPTVGPPWGNDRELAAPLLLLPRGLLRVRVRTPVFLAGAVPLWSETLDFGGQRAAPSTWARTPHPQADQRQDQRDARPVASDAIDALVELGKGIGAAVTRTLRHVSVLQCAGG